MAKITASVVVTVFNEENAIQSLIDSLLKQTIGPKEIIIVDGGSTDSTFDVLKKFTQVKSFLKPGNRSVGRNFGVSKSTSQLIAFTDAGCIPESNWLQELIKPFSDKSVQVISGYYKGQAKTIFQKCLIPYVLVMPDKANLTEFYPATRSMAIRKSLFIQSGGFDEKLAHNEDYAFAHKLKSLGINFVFAPKAVVTWIPRQDLKSAAWMFMRFAIGDIQAGILRPKVKLLALRYYLFFFLFFINHWFVLLAVPYLIWTICKNYHYVKDIRALFWLPVLQLTADTCVLFGTIIGMLSK